MKKFGAITQPGCALRRYHNNSGVRDRKCTTLVVKRPRLLAALSGIGYVVVSLSDETMPFAGAPGTVRDGCLAPCLHLLRCNNIPGAGGITDTPVVDLKFLSLMAACHYFRLNRNHSEAVGLIEVQRQWVVRRFPAPRPPQVGGPSRGGRLRAAADQGSISPNAVGCRSFYFGKPTCRGWSDRMR